MREMCSDAGWNGHSQRNIKSLPILQLHDRYHYMGKRKTKRSLRGSRAKLPDNVFRRALSLYDGDQSGAIAWLEMPIATLGNQRPRDLAQTERGAREVENLIGRIEHGIVS